MSPTAWGVAAVHAALLTACAVYFWRLWRNAKKAPHHP